MTDKTESWIIQTASEIQKNLQALAESTPSLKALVSDPSLRPLYQSEYYSLLAGGKRIRPLMTLEVCRILGGDVSAAMPLACAAEMIHTYSLIHDDLPCMDNDDIRRGKPTNHKVYGEAIAILAGDGLLSDAFAVASSASHLSCEQKLAAIRVLSEAAGSTGMVGGQVMDLEGEQAELPLESLLQLHSRKTGAMIRASVQLGMIAAGIMPNESAHSTNLDRTESAQLEEKLCCANETALHKNDIWNALTQYASDVGLAFQVVDDVLDVTANAAALGKSVGKDKAEHKTTFLKYYCVEEALEYARKLSEHACSVIEEVPGNERLCDLARYLSERNH